MGTKLRSLKYRGNELAQPKVQLEILNHVAEDNVAVPFFESKLIENGMFPLKPTALEILQINVGYMCNLTCEHCHVDAGPERKEIMTRETMQECLRVIDESKSVSTVDLTGGAPEMNPDFKWFVEELSHRKIKVIVRSNLTILVSNKNFRTFPQFFKDHKIEVIASLPCYTQENVDKQRGDGVFNDSIEALKILNELGYGLEGSGLDLNLVFNPGGSSLPPDQITLQADYKRELKEHFNIHFNKLYTITNLPISRFLEYLIKAERFEEYMEKLANAFNPTAAEGVMCKNTLSISWDGKLYDCDFNQMLELELENGLPKNIKDLKVDTIQNRNIVISQHCYGCTAGAGSSCQGSLL